MPHVRQRQTETDRAWRAKRKEELAAAKLVIAIAESSTVSEDVKADVLALWREADGAEALAPSSDGADETHIKDK